MGARPCYSYSRVEPLKSTGADLLISVVNSLDITSNGHRPGYLRSLTNLEIVVLEPESRRKAHSVFATSQGTK